MTPSHLQARFTQSCLDAAFGYSQASMAACAFAVSQNLEFMANAMRATSEAVAAQSTPVRPRAPATPAIPATPFDLWLKASAEWTDAMFSPMQSSYTYRGSPLPLAPFKLWLDMIPLNARPSSWPMAYAWVAAGVPGAVAWPAAKANAAALDAAEAVVQSLDEGFANYRSDSGYAVAQIAGKKWLHMALFFTSPAALAFAFPMMPTTPV